MTERRGRVGMIRRPVAREVQIAMDAHHRAASRAWIRDVARADLPQPRPEISDECEHRLAHLALVARLVIRKPVAIVVAAQFLEKFEESRREVALCHRSPSRQDEFVQYFEKAIGVISNANPRAMQSSEKRKRKGRKLPLDAQMEDAVARRGFEHRVALRLCRTGNVASAARIVERQFEHLAARHLLQSHLRARPVERTLDASQVEANRNSLAARFHASMILTTPGPPRRESRKWFA